MALEDEENQQHSIPSLPQDIIIQIFQTLQVESLLRCKSVCKLWHSLISDPHFIKSHYTLSTNNKNSTHHLLLLKTQGLNSCVAYDVLLDKTCNPLPHNFPLERTPKTPFFIAGSCNGLLCVYYENDTPFIYNPSTRIWKRTPLSGFPMDSEWITTYGFGHDELNDDYKVIGFSYCNSRRGNGTKVKLYSLKSGYWRDMDIYDIPYNVSGTGLSTFSNGALHWLIEVSKSFYHTERDVSNSLMIASFHLGNESCYEVLQPVYDEGDIDVTLGVLGEFLCMICTYDLSYADVWVMKVYGEKDSWTKLASIPYLTHPRMNRYSVPLFVSNDGKVLLKFGYQLVVYDSKSTPPLVFKNFDMCYQACTVVESLVSPICTP